MTDGQRTFTAEENELLMGAAARVLLATVAADASGPVAYFEEMTAAGTFLYDARNRYPDNSLVQALFEHGELPETMDVEGEVTQESLLEDISRIDGILPRDREGLEFRQFLYDLAERIAKASRTGWFGKRISEGEAAFLRELKERLGLET